MVVAVNGKSVGGMTLTGLEIEFELGGPDMTLLVSRYKFADDVQADIAQLERSHVNAIDTATNDDRQVGWIDLGAVMPTSGVTSHVIRPSPVNMDDNSTNLSEADDSDETVYDEPEPLTTKIGTAQNKLHQPTTASSFSNPLHGDKHISKGVFVPIRHKSESCGTTMIDTATNSLPEKIPIQGINRLLSNGTGNDEKIKNLRMNSTQSLGTSDSEDIDSDDGNAWCGCVCGQTHQKKTSKHPEIFWIQCDTCSTWYDCSSTCVGFTSNDAETKSRWICWGCPTPESDPSTMITTEMSKPSGRVSLSPVTMECTARQTTTGDSGAVVETTTFLTSDKTSTSVLPSALPKPHQNDVTANIKAISTTSSRESEAALSISKETKQAPEDKKDDDRSVYVVDDMVYVEEHSWSRVNNPEGIAKVVKAYLDDDGDPVYDIRYVVGGKANGVLPEYLTRYFFSYN